MSLVEGTHVDLRARARTGLLRRSSRETSRWLDAVGSIARGQLSWGWDQGCRSSAAMSRSLSAGVASLAALCSFMLVVYSPMALAADQLQIYIRAFIPQKHSSVRPLPNSGGGTMVEPPASPIVGCFPTDQRSFSTEVSASSRVASIATIDLGSPARLLRQDHPPNESNAVDCGDGRIINRERTDTSDQKFTFLPADQSKVARLTIHASGHNPNFRWAPAIDIDGTFLIDLEASSIRFEGSVDQYPAYEAYAKYNSGPAVTIFQIMPDYGKTALDLAWTRSVRSDAVRYK